MAELETLILEHLKRFQAGQDRIERDLVELKRRMGGLEQGLAGVRRDMRIERRLEIAE